MFIVESEFRNKYVIRTHNALPKRITTLGNMPKEPIYHFISDGEQLGPRPTDMIVHAITEAADDLAIYVHHITDLTVKDTSGYLANRVNKDKEYIQTYHKQYRQFTRVFDIDKTLSKRSPIIISYQMIPMLYPIKTKRPDTFRTIESLWYENILATAFSLETERTQFIPISMPRALKPLTYYQDLIKNPRVTELNKIKAKEDLVLLDLLAFYSGMNEEYETIIGKYIKPETNLILALRDDINVFYFDIGDMSEWMEEDTNSLKKLNWLYSIFEHLVSLRPAEQVVEEIDYQEHIEKVKANAKAELVKGSDVTVQNIDKAILGEADKLLTNGSITEGEYKGNLKLATRYQNLKNPLGEGKLIDVLEAKREIKNVPKSTIPEMDAIQDKSILSNSVRLLDEEYIEKYLDRDILRTVMQLQREGVIITDIKSEVIEDVTGKTRILSIQTKPVKGDIATFKVEYPVVNKDGTFKLNGVDYRMNKQRVDLPIVKLTPNNVALTSAMSKMFVTRGERKASSYPEWLYANLLNLKEHNYITLKVGGRFVSDPSLPLPDTYSILAKRFSSLTFKEFKLNFDYKKREEILKKNETKKITALEDGGILVGTYKDNYLFIDESNNFYYKDGKKDEVVGTIEDIIGLDKKKVPIEFSEVKVKGKSIPVGCIIAYWMGISKFFNYLGVKVTEYEPNQRIVGEEDLVIKFKDVKLNVECSTKTQRLLVGGFNYFKNHLKTTNMEELEKDRGYFPVFSSRGIGPNQANGLTRIERMWVDPITHDLLVDMDEPTEMIDIFIRATELLTNQQHYDETDGDLKYHRGYNRFNDIIYKELMLGIGELNRGNTTAKRTFSINPQAVIKSIAMDEGVSPAEIANPMKSVCSQERITFSGAGGRSADSMVGRHRMYHKNDMGVISECFTDSGKAGTILYYTANPEIDNIYGKPKHSKDRNKEMGNLFNVSMAVCPYLMKDDAKRGNFARIHYDAWANANGQITLPCRTGGELGIAHKAGDRYALIATDDGKVTEVTDKGMVIKYAKGEEVTYPLGRKFGNDSGKTIPQEMITDRKANYKFSKGEVLAWDGLFFERDLIETTQVAMYTGLPAVTVLRETVKTYEDSSIQSKAFAEKLTSKTTHIRDILLGFEDSIKLLVKEGDHLDSDTVIANILPPGVEFTEDTTNLDFHSMTSPRAKYVGHVERIEVLYCGLPEDASPSIKSIITKGDKERKDRAKYTKEYPKGEISDPTHIGKNFINRDNCLIRIYVTHDLGFSNGDKYGLGHQLKSVSSGVFNTEYTTVSGLPIDVEFSYNGIMARIVESPVAIGIQNMYIWQVGLNACKIYEGKDPKPKSTGLESEGHVEYDDLLREIKYNFKERDWDVDRLTITTTDYCVTNDGSVDKSRNRFECAGSWTESGTVHLGSKEHLTKVLEHYKLSWDIERFTKYIAYHECAHEVWANILDPRTRAIELSKIPREFNTPYLDTIKDKKSSHYLTERFCEWIGSIYSTPELYHVSFDKNLPSKLKPRTITGYTDGGKFKESRKPRVCFSTTAEGGIRAIYPNISSVVENNPNIKNGISTVEMTLYKAKYEGQPLVDTETLLSDKEVWDAGLTNEYWILDTIELEKVKTISVDFDLSKPFVSVLPFSKDTELETKAPSDYEVHSPSEIVID